VGFTATAGLLVLTALSPQLHRVAAQAAQRRGGAGEAGECKRLNKVLTSEQWTLLTHGYAVDPGQGRSTSAAVVSQSVSSPA
jgi:hypothetical protein